MTDNKIKKALECCADTSIWHCEKCPLKDGMGFVCIMQLSEYAIDLINRQQAEIERLKKCRKDEVYKIVSAIDKVICEAKAEAYKECLEKVNERLAVHSFTSNSTEYDNGMYDCIEWVDSKIEELEKELVGEDK